MNTTERAQGEPRAAATSARAEPRLHAIASIQAGGLLLLMTDDWQIEGVSANCADFLGRGPSDVIGHPASDFLADDAIHALRNRLALLRDPEGVERLFAHRLLGDDQRFDIAIHCFDHRVIVEAEPTAAKPYGDATGTLRGMLARLDQAQDRAAFLAEGTRQLRALTGFDRVMTLRFDADGSSEVVGEHARGGIGSLLGSRWPATPLSAEERQDLARPPLHLIADLDAGLVEVLSIDDIAILERDCAVLHPAAADLADALRALGVRASMTVPLVVGGALWGAIACHHFQPRRPAFERRSIVELFAAMFAMRLEIRELKKSLATRA